MLTGSVNLGVLEMNVFIYSLVWWFSFVVKEVELAAFLQPQNRRFQRTPAKTLGVSLLTDDEARDY
jgi:hypothetical protein